MAIASTWAQQRGRRAAVRVGLSAAVGWSGITLRDAPAFAAALRGHPLSVTLWTHLTERGLAQGQAADLREAAAIFRSAGVEVDGIDYTSSASALWMGPGELGDHARIGVGLFGAKGAPGEGGPDITCAISVIAPVSGRSVGEPGRRVGYGDFEVDAGQALTTVRCGYGDGFPRGLARTEKILAVGMQYTTLLTDNAHSDSTIALIDETTDLDALALRANCLPHEIVVALGVHSSVRERSHE